MAWALSSVLTREVAMLPSADLSRLVIGAGQSDRAAQDREERKIRFRKLLLFLTSNHQGERFLLATSSSRLAAPIIVRTGQAVMAMGGFMGRDPILTPERLARMVQDKQVRFIMLGDFSLAGRKMGAEAAEKPIADWVRKNGRPVDPALWRTTSPLDGTSAPAPTSLRPDLQPIRPSANRDSSGRVSLLELYDLRPE
jgi:hypothetical protein